MVQACNLQDVGVGRQKIAGCTLEPTPPSLLPGRKIQVLASVCMFNRRRQNDEKFGPPEQVEAHDV